MDPIIFGQVGKSRNRRITEYANYIKSLSSLVAYYPLNETSGNAINQAPATVGTLDGTVTGATQGVTGRMGKAYSFDGVDDEIDMGSDGSLAAGTGDFTFGGLFYVENSTTSKVPLSSRTSSNSQGYDILLQSGSVAGAVKARIGGTLIDILESPTWTVITNNWHFIVGTVDRSANTLRLYGDGASKGTTDITGVGTMGNSQNLNVGKRGTLFFNKQAQHIFIMSRVITATEAAKLASLAGVS